MASPPLPLLVVGSALVSESDVSLSRVSLLDGVVKADSIELVATADAGPSSADADDGRLLRQRPRGRTAWR